MDTVKIIGIKRTKSKTNGRDAFTYFYTQPFNDYDVNNAVSLAGVTCGSEYSGLEFDVKIGDEVELRYSKGYQNKAQLSGMVVVKPAVPVK